MADLGAYLKALQRAAAPGLDASGVGRYRDTGMRTVYTSLFATVVLAWAGCSRPPAGVLTLAPAGMRTTGACIANPDGTLDAPPGASAESVAYMDAATATVTITARTLSGTDPVSVDLWFAGTKVGTATVQSTQAVAFPFHVEPRVSGPQALRLTLSGTAPGPAASQPVLHIEKLVVTQP